MEESLLRSQRSLLKAENVFVFVFAAHRSPSINPHCPSLDNTKTFQHRSRGEEKLSNNGQGRIKVKVLESVAWKVWLEINKEVPTKSVGKRMASMGFFPL